MHSLFIYLKGFLLIVFVGGIEDLFSQELVFETNMTLKYGLSKKTDVLSVSQDERLALFFLYNTGIKSIMLDEDFQQVDEYEVPRPQVVHNRLLGHGWKSNDYYLYFSNNKKNQFFVQNINIKEKREKSQIVPLKLKKEKFLNALNYNGKFYILTVKKSSSILKIYEFEGFEIRNQKEFDFSDQMYFTDLYTILSRKVDLTEILSVTKIDAKNPTSLEIASQANKLYVSQTGFSLTIDNNPKNTKIIDINLNTYEYSYKKINQIDLRCDLNTPYTGSNSFLLDSILFQINACKSNLLFSLTNIYTKELITKYSVSADEEIKFKNGPIKQEGGTSIYTQGTDKELDKTKQILRKISNSKIGVSAYQSNSTLLLTIGGYKELDGASGFGMASNPGMTLTPGTNFSTPYGNFSTPATYSFNPEMFSYGSYTTTRAVYFKSILSLSDFEHIKEASTETPYDKIKDFEESIKTTIKNETLFRINESYIFGYFSKSENLYVLTKF